MSVQKYTAKNGKTQWYFSVRYYTWNGELKQKKKEGFKTQKEAKEAEKAFLNSKRTDIQITFANIVEAYLENREARIEQTTIATKGHMIRTKILPYFGEIVISDITPNMVQRWQTELINYTNPKNGQPYSQTYLRQIHNQLSTIFNFAIRYYGLASNPAQNCGSMGKQNAEKFDFWTYDEFQQFIKATTEDLTAYTIFNLFFFGGMREGELLALTLNDFDFSKNTVEINKSLAVINGKAVVKKTKTANSERVIALPAPIMEMVSEYSKHIYSYEPTDRLFNTSKTALTRSIKEYSKKANIRKIKIHELRHSHASHLIELGVPVLAISKRLGHKDIKTTLNTYSHLYPNKQNEIAEMLADLCGNN